MRNSIGTSSTCRIRVLHADDEKGRCWCGFVAEVANTAVCGISTLNKIEAVDSLTRSVMVMMIIVVELTKCSRHEEIGGISTNGVSIDPKRKTAGLQLMVQYRRQKSSSPQTRQVVGHQSKTQGSNIE